MWSAWRCKRGSGEEGFSLAESAIALVIVATVVGAMVPAFLSVRSGEQARATRETLETVMHASAAYVQANGCFPCPVPPSLLNESEGEFGAVGGVSNVPCGSCPAAVGLVPFRSLGLPQSMARDGYGRYLTFAVDVALTQSNLADLTCKTGDDQGTSPPCTANDITDHKRIKGLCKKPISTASGLSVATPFNGTQRVALLVLSHGANGRGAYRERGAGTPRIVIAPACALASNAGSERCNTDENVDFVEALAAKGNDPFDDQMVYFGRNALMTFAGGVACGTEWP